MAVGAVASTKLFIGTTEAVASPDDYVEIKDINNLGNLAQQFAKIAVESVGDGNTRQIKGTFSVSPFDLMLNRNDTDAGQIAVIAALADRNSLFNFRLLENDNTAKRFKGRVYSGGSNYGGVNDLKRVAVSIEVEPDSIFTD